MATEKKFMLISIRDNKLKVKVDQYNPENNDAFQKIRKLLTSMPVCVPTPRARSIWLCVSTPARIRMNGWNA